MSVLNPIGDELWEMSRPLEYRGLRIDHRMTVARLPSGGLFIHSPVACDHTVVGALEALGRVECLVAPSLFHDMYWRGWFERFPGARYFCPPKMAAKQPGIPFHEISGPETDAPWRHECEMVPIDGMPSVNEIVFLHRRSRSVLVADLIFNLSAEQPLIGKALIALNGMGGRPGASRIFRLFIRNRTAFRGSLDRVLDWDFDPLVPGHGALIPTGGRQILREAYASIG